jgi:hypothetical protein
VFPLQPQRATQVLLQRVFPHRPQRAFQLVALP